MQGLEGGAFAREGAEEILHGAGSVEVVAGISKWGDVVPGLGGLAVR